MIEMMMIINTVPSIESDDAGDDSTDAKKGL